MQDVQLAPTVNIMDMVAQKCEDMKQEMLKDVQTVRDQTRGELSRAADTNENAARSYGRPTD